MNGDISSDKVLQDIVYQKGKDAIEAKNWLEAYECFQAIHNVNPDYEGVKKYYLYAGGKLAYESGDWEEADRNLKAVREIDPDFKDCVDVLGTIEQKQSAEELYIKACDLVAQQKKTIPENQDWKQILSLLRKAQKFDPKAASEILNKLQELEKEVENYQSIFEKFISSLDRADEYLREIDEYLTNEERRKVSSQVKSRSVWWLPWTWRWRSEKPDNLLANARDMFEEAKSQVSLLPNNTSQRLDNIKARLRETESHLKENIDSKLKNAQNVMDSLDKAQQDLQIIQEFYSEYREREIKNILRKLEEAIGLRRPSRWKTWGGAITVALSVIIALGSIIFGVDWSIMDLINSVEPPVNINRVVVYKDSAEFDINKEQIIKSGQEIQLEVIAFDEKENVYDDDDLECEWSIGPISDVDRELNSELLNTKDCKVSYTASQEYGVKKIVIVIKGQGQKIKVDEPVSVKFQIIE